MEIELKNGERLKLEITPLILEYLDDYPGGLEKLKKDASEKSMYAVNQFLYAIIASNYDMRLTYRQALRLVKFEDVEKIIDFSIKNTPQNKNYTFNNDMHRI